MKLRKRRSAWSEQGGSLHRLFPPQVISQSGQSVGRFGGFFSSGEATDSRSVFRVRPFCPSVNLGFSAFFSVFILCWKLNCRRSKIFFLVVLSLGGGSHQLAKDNGFCFCRNSKSWAESERPIGPPPWLSTHTHIHIHSHTHGARKRAWMLWWPRRTIIFPELEIRASYFWLHQTFINVPLGETRTYAFIKAGRQPA